MDDPAAGFADLLYHFRRRADLSQADLGRLAGVNPSYINRLESGERNVPTPEITAALARALQLSLEETDRLLWRTAQLPPSLQRLRGGERTILAVARVLTDDRLSREARAEFRACIDAIARHWSEDAR